MKPPDLRSVTHDKIYVIRLHSHQGGTLAGATMVGRFDAAARTFRTTDFDTFFTIPWEWVKQVIYQVVLR